MKNLGVKKIWIRKNIKKNKKYGLAFDEKPAWREKKRDYKKNMNYGLAFDEKPGCKKNMD